jgi:hypothetical protein
MGYGATEENGMSEQGKIRRQGKRSKKVAYLARLQECNYDWLCQLSRQKRVSIAKLLNAILHDKPNPNELLIK